MTSSALSTPARSRSRSSKRVVRLPYVLPAAIFLGVLAAYPLVQLVRMSLSEVSARTLRNPWEFIGFDNFIKGFESGDTQAALVRTLIFVAIVFSIGMVGGLAAAIALRERRGAGGFLLALMVFVWALPPVVNGSVWKFLMGEAGLFNEAARGLGLGTIPFLYDPNIALISVALVTSWAVIPFNALVFRAALLGVPHEAIEAARLDGARPWQEIRHILIPSARPTAIVLSVLTLVYAFKGFDYIYVMTLGGPGTATVTLPFLGYLQAFARFDFGLGSATALIAGALVVVLAVFYARNVRKEETS